MKHLPKHVRPRWRYLAVGIETWPDADLSRGAFQRALWFAAQNLVGDTKSADADLTVFDFSFAAGTGETIVRVRRGEVETARAALACIDALNGTPVGLRVRGVSGTVRACEERYLGRRAGVSRQRTVVFDSHSRTVSDRGRAADVHLSGGFAGATDLDFE
jgi:ribonuclease P/MRP protein subunit POP5